MGCRRICIKKETEEFCEQLRYKYHGFDMCFGFALKAFVEVRELIF